MAHKATQDLAEFVQLSNNARNPPCKLAVAVARLLESDQQLVWAAVEDTARISPDGIAKWMSQKDAPVSTNAVATHRQHRCACYRSQLRTAA